MNKRTVGTSYEKLAAAYLQRQGYEILAYNFRCRMGEIDMIAKDGEYLVFVEVKYRSGSQMGNPLEAVHWKKQQIISRAASYYCWKHGYAENTPCRFDVVGICGEEYMLIKNAFEYAAW